MKLRKINKETNNITGMLSFVKICVCYCQCFGGRTAAASSQGWGNNAIGLATDGFYGFGNHKFETPVAGGGAGGVGGGSW